MRLIIDIEMEKDGRWLAEVWEIHRKEEGEQKADIHVIGRGDPDIKAYGKSRDEAVAKAQAQALKKICRQLETGEIGPESINITFIEENASLIEQITALIEDHISAFVLIDKDGKLVEILTKVTKKPEELTVEESSIFAHTLMKGIFLKELLKIKENIILPDMEPIIKIKPGKVTVDLNKLFLTQALDFMKNIDDNEIKKIYEDYYVPKLIDDAPEIIRRAIILRQHIYKNKPSDKLMKYCKEAFLTFIYGFHNSCVILLRTVLEAALKEKYNFDVGTFGKLNKYLYDNGLITKEIYKNNNKINEDARDAVHNLAKGIEISEGKVKHLIEISSKNLKLIFT